MHPGVYKNEMGKPVSREVLFMVRQSKRGYYEWAQSYWMLTFRISFFSSNKDFYMYSSDSSSVNKFSWEWTVYINKIFVDEFVSSDHDMLLQNDIQ